MTCYFQGCGQKGTTKEHIPPRAFFPDDERLQLLTVGSCPGHNSAKSKDDLYVLAHICMNASPSNRAREVFLQRVAPQIGHNGGKLRDLLAKGSIRTSNGVAYAVDVARFDAFFTALCYGLIFKSHGRQLPPDYVINHIYHRFSGRDGGERTSVEAMIDGFYEGKPLASMTFGSPDARNQRIYSLEIFGIPDFGGSITIVHRFFGTFKVTSMLTRTWSDLRRQPASAP